MSPDTPLLESDLPGWSPPRRQPSSDPLDPTATVILVEGRPPPGAGEQLGDEPLPPPPPRSDDLPPPGSPTTTLRGPGSSRAFTDPRAFLPVVEALVGMGSMGVHFARRAPGDLWIADADDVANIAAPLARIAARHSPVSGAEASDLGDGLAAAVGVANYAMKNVQREAEHRARPLESVEVNQE